MPITDDDRLGAVLEKRLKTALDEVVPPAPSLASARYRIGAVKRLSRAWRFAPALVAIAAAGAAISATAATGSPNPSVWRDRAGTVIQNVSHPGSIPKSTKSPKPGTKANPDDKGGDPARPAPSSNREPKESPQPPERPEPSDRPEPTPTPGSDGGDNPSGRPEPSPTPTDGGGD